MEQLKTLNEIIPTLRSKKTGTLIKLYTNNSHDYELLQDSVEKLKYQFFTIKPKHERPIKVVVKGLPKNTKTRDIHQNLIKLGFTVDKVTQLVGKITKQPLPVFLINLPRNIHNLKIFHLTLLCYLTVRVEGYDGKGVTQCYSCNKFHHTAENCHFTPRCLKCGEAHQTRECAIKKLEKTYCINCHVYGHMANYSRCPLYPKPRKGTNITPNNYATALDNLIRPNTSFAQAVTKSTNNSRNPQQMAAPSNTRRNPAIFSQKRTNQIVTPTPTNNNITNENNSPQNIILQTLQQTIQALTLLTQQVSNLNFNNPTPKPKKNKSAIFPTIIYPLPQHIEATIVVLTPPNFNPISIASVYVPPKSDERLFTLDFEQLLQTNSNCVIFGDLNATHNEWNCLVNSTRGKQLKTFTDTLNLTIAYPSSPTRFGHGTSNTLDIAVINNFNFPFTMDSIPELSSDHNPVFLNFSLTSPIHQDNARAVTTCCSSGPACSDDQKANLLAITLKDNFTENERPNGDYPIDNTITTTLENFFSHPPPLPITPTDPDEVLNYIETLSNNKAPENYDPNIYKKRPRGILLDSYNPP
ncbi:nucleic-acid-binding protein from transposon X-element [Trichonephila clavipes]|nr:nucleic-acid-binding protein from transposon X-element [Trichonephila clavipes]